MDFNVIAKAVARQFQAMMGKSGRVVLEIEPELKQRLYSTLALEHKTLKEWFILAAEEYILDRARTLWIESRTAAGLPIPAADVRE